MTASAIFVVILLVVCFFAHETWKMRKIRRLHKMYQAVIFKEIEERKRKIAEQTEQRAALWEKMGRN